MLKPMNAADVTAARLMEVDPGRVGYLAEAGRFLGQSDPGRMEQRGEDVERSAGRFAPAPGFESLTA